MFIMMFWMPLMLLFWLILIGGWVTVIVLTHRYRPQQGETGRGDQHEQSGAGGADGAAIGTYDGAPGHADGAPGHADGAPGHADGTPGHAGGTPRQGEEDDKRAQARQINQTDLID